MCFTGQKVYLLCVFLKMAKCPNTTESINSVTGDFFGFLFVRQTKGPTLKSLLRLNSH